MPWTLDVTRSARRDLDSVQQQRDREAIATAIDRLTDNPGAVDIKKLEGSTWRLRVGRWRAIFEMNNVDGIIRIPRVRSRNEGTYRG